MGREKGRKSLLTKTLEKCYSLGKSPKHNTNNNPKNLPPSGYFSVYVGPQKERFVIRMTHLNHPLFRTLLEEAELVYGYDAKGPLVLPCDVESFLDTVWEIENEAVDRSPVCGMRTGKYQLLSLSNVEINQNFSFPFSPLRR
ncbi:hypothetical protein LUZ60_002048 [Juncus effusus]|nr:hypothetical protein LUZ60_002048 [Juncus effusus]